MTTIDANVRLDDTLLASVDQVADRLGVTREYMLEDSIRRGLAGRLLERVGQQLSSARDAPGEDEVSDLAASEIAAARQARRRRR